MATVAASALLAACAETPSGEVVLYTSMPNAIVEQLAGVVERRFPDLDGNYWYPSRGGITLDIVRGRTADIERRIAEEIEQGDIKADVIWLAEPSSYEKYKELDLLAPYEPPESTPILSEYTDPDGFYVPGRIISMVLAWNTSLHPDPLLDWPDLQPLESTAFPAPESGAARATIKALLDSQGFDYFASLGEGGGVSVASNGAARDGLVAGSFEAVAVLDYMARKAKARGSRVDYAYPASGTVVIPSPLAITADAPNPEAARVFVDFIMSQSGQEIIVELGSFYPVREDVDPPSGAPPLDSIPALDLDWSALARETDNIRTIWADVYGSR